MNVLLVGGAGMVGSIVRPAIELAHETWVFDRARVPQAVRPGIVADVNDDTAVQAAVAGMQAVVYLAMGTPATGPQAVDTIDLAFDVNVRAVYRFLHYGLRAGVRRFVFASTFDVYGKSFYGRMHRFDPHTRELLPPELPSDTPMDEDAPLLGWRPYAMSKRLAEQLCVAAAEQEPEATITVLRLITPRDEENFPAAQASALRRGSVATGPNDLRRLILAALALDRPGAHLIHASSDVEGRYYSNQRAYDILGWKPEGN